MRAEISCGVYFLPSISSGDQFVPMCRLTLRMVRSTLVTAWFLADWPTRTSPFLANATTDGVVREPSEFAMTVGSPPSRTVTTELVVPRSIPTARAMGMASLPCSRGGAGSVSLVGRGPHGDLRGVHSTFLPRLTAGIAAMFPGCTVNFLSRTPTPVTPGSRSPPQRYGPGVATAGLRYGLRRVIHRFRRPPAEGVAVRPHCRNAPAPACRRRATVRPLLRTGRAPGRV